MLDKKQMTSQINTIGRNTKALRDRVQTVLINAAAHAYQHNDPVFFEKLFANASGMNRKKMTAWIHEYGFARIQKDGSFKLNKAAVKGADYENGEQVVEYLTDNAPLWYADEETAAQVKSDLDVAARVKSLAAQVANAKDQNRNVKVDCKALREAMLELEAAVTDTADSLDAEPAH